jgi:hypothetical protein
MKIYLATWTEKSQKESLDKKGYQNRLLSYWFLSADPKVKKEQDLYLQNPQDGGLK